MRHSVLEHLPRHASRHELKHVLEHITKQLPGHVSEHLLKCVPARHVPDKLHFFNIKKYVIQNLSI